MPDIDGFSQLIAACIVSCGIVTAVTGDLVVWPAVGAAIVVSLWVAEALNR